MSRTKCESNKICVEQKSAHGTQVEQKLRKSLNMTCPIVKRRPLFEVKAIDTKKEKGVEIPVFHLFCNQKRISQMLYVPVVT
jgi:hypothetical protein